MKHLESALNKRNSFWKYIVVLFISFILASFVGDVPLMIVAVIKIIQNVGDMVSGMAMMSDPTALGISSNFAFVLLLFPLVLGFFILLFFIKLLNGQSFQEVINGTTKVRWPRFFTGAACWSLLMLIPLVIQYFIFPSVFTFQLDITSFIPLVFISLILIPFQTSFEELAFRGYLAQGLGNLTKNRWAVLIIPSLIFALLHVANPEVKEFGFFIMMANYLSMGLILGLVSILDDGIEVAMGIHAANNIFASLFVTHASSAFQTDAVFSIKEVDPVGGLIEVVIAGTLLILFLYKRYGWKFSTMNKKIQISPVEEDGA